MAIDFEAAKEAIDEMRRKAMELSQLADEAVLGVYRSGSLGDKPFTNAEKTELKNRYDALKTELQILYTQLP